MASHPPDGESAQVYTHPVDGATHTRSHYEQVGHEYNVQVSGRVIQRTRTGQQASYRAF